MTTTETALRPELTALPERMKKLPVHRGYPTPFFVAVIDGVPDFRLVEAGTRARAIRKQLCWVCGEPLGTRFVFVAGPMCCVSRTSMEPPSHRECAVWSAHNCPFLSRPHMVRRENEHAAETTCPGHMIERNPGVMALWTTRSYRLFGDGAGGVLIEMGMPERIEWVREGRPATREEIEESIRTGLPHLTQLALSGGDAAGELADIEKRLDALRLLMPPGVTE